MGYAEYIMGDKSMADNEKKQLFVYEHDAGRLELLVRILYWVLIGIVLWVYGFIASLCLIIQWFHILIFGSRNEGLSEFSKGYLEYLVHVMGYMYFMTDNRPDIIPVTIRIFEEKNN
jgi:hypothetical protein